MIWLLPHLLPPPLVCNSVPVASLTYCPPPPGPPTTNAALSSFYRTTTTGEVGPLKGVDPKTRVHKTTKVPVFYVALGLYDLMRANPLLGPFQGVALVMDVALIKIITSRAI
jgi:hypothetical protein